MNYLQDKKDYINTMVALFPNTLFQWAFIKHNDPGMKWTKLRTYRDTDQRLFWLKPAIYRSTLWDKQTDELRLDLDYDTLEENTIKANVITDKLNELGIAKYLVSVSGGKGIHITLRYNYTAFDEYDRALVRETIFNYLDLDLAIDKKLYRTTQVLGCEGFKHRKTLKPKQLITIKDNTITILDNVIEPLYLTDSYVNSLSDIITNDVLNVLTAAATPPQKKVLFVDNTPPAFYNDTKFSFHYNRFIEMYLNLNEHGLNRTQDMFIRYIYLTVKNEEVTRYYYKLFTDAIGMSLSVEQIKMRVGNTIHSMKANAIFIYPDVFTKEDFYKTYNQEVIVNG
jgi:hypothetical protein